MRCNRGLALPMNEASSNGPLTPKRCNRGLELLPMEGNAQEKLINNGETPAPLTLARYSHGLGLSSLTRNASKISPLAQSATTTVWIGRNPTKTPLAPERYSRGLDRTATVWVGLKLTWMVW